MLLNLTNVVCGVEDGDYAGYTLFSPDLEGKRARYTRNRKCVVCIDQLPVEALRHEETVKNMTAHSGVEQRGIGRDEEEGNKSEVAYGNERKAALQRYERRN